MRSPGSGPRPRSTGPGDLIAGLDPPDDAAAYRVSDDLAIIGTLDFFPPLVDDPRTFGEIAAANALSDVFAMGGRVLFALSIAAFPEDLPRDVLAAIFEGASSKVREAGGTLAGGHTIRDPEPKYGLAVDRRGASGQAAAQGRRPARRQPPPDQAARDRDPRERPPPGPDERRGPRDRRRQHANPESGRLRGARRGRDPGRDRCDRLRAAGARAGDGPSVRHALRVRGGGVARAPRRARPRTGRRRDRWRGPQPPVRGARHCPSGMASRPSSSRWPTTRRPAVAFWRRSRRTASRRSRPGWTDPASSIGASVVSKRPMTQGSRCGKPARTLGAKPTHPSRRLHCGSRHPQEATPWRNPTFD